MDPLEQSGAVVVVAGLANRLAVRRQRGQQHRQHVGGEVGLAGGQAQPFLGVEHAQLAELRRTAHAGQRLAQAQSGPLQHYLGQLLFVDRLGQVVVHAGLQQCALLVGKRMCGERDHRHRADFPLGLPAADCLGGLAAVHAGHLHVHEDQVEALALHYLEGRVAAVHRGDLGAEVAEQGLHQQQVGRVVVDAEQPWRPSGNHGVGLVAARRADLKQLLQLALQLAGAGGLGLDLFVGQGRVVLRLLGGRAEHQGLAAEPFEFPERLAQLFRRMDRGRDAEHRQADRQLAGRRVAQAFLEAVEVGEFAHFQAEVGELVVQRAARQLLRFEQRHALARGPGGAWLLVVVATFRQTQADPEFGTFPRRTVDADLAAHLLDQALGDHQAQAGATGLPRQ